MSDFITGITDKYPKELLKGRIEIEGNIISCLFKDMLLMDETTFQPKDFITSDGFFYYSMLHQLRKKGFYSLDEVTIVSNLPENVVEKYDDLGGWETIQHQIDIINLTNFDKYSDILYRENILLNMHRDGFNLLNEIDVNGKMVKPLKLFRSMTAEEVTDWYEARLSTYGTGYTSKVIEEEEIDFDDKFIQDCGEGLENGVPFEEAGEDVNLDTINCFPFLSKQINGILESTTTMLGGFSSAGKSTWWITTIMGLLENDRKILIISNEETVTKFKIKFMIWLLTKYERYYKLTKKKLMSGNITSEDREHLKNVQDYWKDKYKGKVKFISINDADMTIIKKKIRENVLRHGYDTVLYDTFKIQATDIKGERTDLSLVRDSRELDKIAKKYNLIMLCSVQLAESMRGTLFLSAAVLSNSKQIKEQLENLLLMRTVYDVELDEKNKLFCRPFRLTKVNDKWIEEKYDCDPTGIYRMLFVEKCRSGANSSDTGIAYLLKYDGDHCVFREVAQCRPKHGTIQ